MAAIKHFRSAFNGFNRDDVIQYIEYLNNQHASQVSQLNSQLQTALARPGDPALQAKLEAAEARCAQLEEQLAALEQDTPINCTEQELEAYRRAERTERIAKDRAQQIYTQANAVLADVTVKAEAAVQQVGALSNQISAQLQQYQAAVSATAEALQDAAATLCTIKPEE